MNMELTKNRKEIQQCKSFLKEKAMNTYKLILQKILRNKLKLMKKVKLKIKNNTTL